MNVLDGRVWEVNDPDRTGNVFVVVVPDVLSNSAPRSRDTLGRSKVLAQRACPKDLTLFPPAARARLPT